MFITEATFALPIYRWRSGAAVAAEILRWWQEAPERPSLLFCYAFGKAQRVLAELARLGVGQPGQPGGEGNEICCTGRGRPDRALPRSGGVVLPPVLPASALPRDASPAGRLVLAPPAAHRSSGCAASATPRRPS